MTKVSVIIPVYNVAPYLEATFKSLQEQTLRDMEIIVVDDGSTDGSEEIIKCHAAADSRIVHVRQPNSGVSAARNAGTKLAHGDYIYFMDADDVIAPDALASAYSRAVAMDADVCIFDADVMYEDDAKPLSWNYRQANLMEEGRLYDGESVMNLMMDHHRYNCVVWLCFIRRSFYVSAGMNFYTGIIHEDQLFITKLYLRCNRICSLHRALVCHRVRRTSLIGRGFTRYNLDCYMTVMDELKCFLPNASVSRYMRFTLPIVFHAGHVLPLRDKWAVFMRALKSGYLRYVGFRSLCVFWLKAPSGSPKRECPVA